MIKEIIQAGTSPVMAKVRIGHFAEAQIIQALGVDMIDESEGMWRESFNDERDWIEIHGGPKHLNNVVFCV